MCLKLNDHPVIFPTSILYFFCGLQLLPDNIHELANGKLHISATDVYTGKNIKVYIFI